VEPKIPNQSEIGHLIDFLNQNLRPNSNWSIKDEYPLVFSEQNKNNLRIISDGEKILAHSAIKYHLVKNVVGIFKVAAIGSVVTDSKHRNQGLSQAVLTDCINTAYNEGADFAILWTDLYDFYRKLDFELAGHEISLILEKNLGLNLDEGHYVTETNKVAPEAINRLYSNHTVGTVRSAEEVRKFLSIPNSRVYCLWDRNNVIKAYAVEGKGMDLDGYIHEWGGDVPSLMQLFSHIREKQNRPIVVISPANSQNLIKNLKKAGATYNEGFLGMIRILHHENIFSKVHRYARSIGVEDFILEKKDDLFTIGRGNQVFQTKDLKDLSRLLFGPYDFTENVSILNPILPIPMWIWGWDSV
jgi:GNAT superfamily N-acetyltransferase